MSVPTVCCWHLYQKIDSQGDEIAFVSRVPERSMAWNTNTDIYIVKADGSSVPQPISSYNKGYDMHPKYSPDGSFIAWLQMPTPQYEADRNRIALYARGLKSLSLLDSEEWDRSPESITWTNDHLVISAQEIGRVKLFTVSFEGIVLPLIEDGHNNQASYVPGFGLVFVKSSLTSPADIFTIADKDAKLVQQTRLNDAYMKEIGMSQPEEFWFRGARERDVHGWLLKPFGFEEGKTYPLAFLIHGGPEGAWNDEWGLRYECLICSHF